MSAHKGNAGSERPGWSEEGMRHELLFGERVVCCYGDRPKSFQAMVEAAVRDRGDHEALVCGEERLSWAELAARAAALAGGLDDAGVGRGDRIVLLLGNGLPFVYLVLAAARLGAIVVPVSTREEKAGLTFILNQCGAKAIFFETELERIIPDAADVPKLAHAIAVDGPGFADLMTAEPAPVAEIDEEDVAAIVYTSGTTGRPKGAMITQVNLIHSLMNFVRMMKMTPEERSVITVPMSHVTGLVALIGVVVAAKSALIVLREFNVRTFLETAARERMTHTALVPAMYNLCLLQSDFTSFDLSNWRLAGYGGAPMPLPTINRLAEVLPHLELMNVYGATETSSPTTGLPPAYAVTHRDSVGLPVPGAEVLIMDDDGIEVPAGEIGELWIKGPMVVRGYWDNPEATAREIVNGYWKSGDLGKRDADGFVYVLDRKKDMINRGGYKIFTAEVESQIAAHPSVVECAVVARQCDVLGERAHAVVVAKAGEGLSAGDLVGFLEGKLASYKMPETWAIESEPLPRNPNGKILKRMLRDGLEPYKHRG